MQRIKYPTKDIRSIRRSGYASTFHSVANHPNMCTRSCSRSTRIKQLEFQRALRISDDICWWQTRQSSGLQPDQHQSSTSGSSNHSRAPPQAATAAGDRASRLGVDKRNGVPEGHKHVSKSQMKGKPYTDWRSYGNLTQRFPIHMLYLRHCWTINILDSYWGGGSLFWDCLCCLKFS